MRNLIGIHGAAGSGKDTIAEYLVAYHDFVRYGFADPIKNGLAIMLGLSPCDFAERERKEAPHPRYGVSPRRMAQTLGTEWGRQMVHPNVWVTAAEVHCRRLACGGWTGIVIPDVRFENEATWIRANGGRIWHILRPDAPVVEAHSSEAGIAYDLAGGDALIHNGGTLERLYEHVRMGLRELGIRP